MKLVATFSKPEEAHLLRAHLEGSGIPTFVRDDQTVSVDWALSNAIGGVKVEVADEDYDEARSVMAEFNLPPAVAPGAKPKKSFERYMKLFAVVFLTTFGLLVWRSFPVPGEAYGMILILSASLAFAVAGFCALFDL